MFNVRKGLVVAITVIMMLAMVVPAAMAAPEVVHGVVINAPTTPDPAYLPAGEDLVVEYTVDVFPYQVDDVYVWAWIQDAYNNNFAVAMDVLANEDLNAGDVEYTITLPVANAPVQDGWYDVKVCLTEADVWPEVWTWCDTEANALLVDRVKPAAWLDKPLGNVWVKDPAKGIWLTGEEYLVGGAKDEWGLDWAEFQYCVISNFWTSEDGTRWNCGPKDNSWITVADGTVSAVINEYGATEYTGTFDTTMVPDDEGVIRFCAYDLAGNKKCDYTQVFIDNEFSINLRPGWNLISTPTALYDADIEDVLHHLLTLNKVGVVYAYDKCCGWKMFDPGAGPDSLTKIEPGKGYWIWMNGEATGQLPLTFWGTWKQVGNNLPQSIAVYKGWNLPGYVQWGRPTAPFFPASLAADYLANLMTPIPGVGQGVQALVKYNAVTGVYEAVQYWDRMELGKGYWLASDVDGTIVPAQW